MLAVWGNWALPIGMSFYEKRGKRKLDLVELIGAGSTRKRAPNKREQYSYGIGRLLQRGILFISRGLWAESYVFLKTAQAPISILNRKLACLSKGHLSLGNYFSYPTSEEIAVQFKVSAEIVIGKFSLEFPLLVV